MLAEMMRPAQEPPLRSDRDKRKSSIGTGSKRRRDISENPTVRAKPTCPCLALWIHGPWCQSSSSSGVLVLEELGRIKYQVADPKRRAGTGSAGTKGEHIRDILYPAVSQ